MNIKVSFKGVLKKYDTGFEWGNVVTIADVILSVPGLKSDPLKYLVTCNGELCDESTKLEDGDEILILQQIVGG